MLNEKILIKMIGNENLNKVSNIHFKRFDKIWGVMITLNDTHVCGVMRDGDDDIYFIRVFSTSKEALQYINNSQKISILI